MTCASARAQSAPAIPGGVVGELGRVGVVPELARGLVEAQAAGGAGVLDRGGEQTDQAGAGERVAAAAFG